MKKFLIGTVCLVVGFAAGSWTPLGDMGSVRNLLSLAGFEMETSAPTSALISRPVTEKTSQVLALSSSLTDLSTLTESREIMKALSNLAKQENGINAVESIGAATISKLTNEQVAALEAEIAAFEDQNARILEALTQIGSNHPEFYALNCLYESNLSGIALDTFLLTHEPATITLDDLSPLQQTFNTQENKVLIASRMGRILTQQMQIQIAAIPAANEAEVRALKITLDILESYLLTFDIEDALAANYSLYPQVLADAMLTGGQNLSSAQWAEEGITLLNARSQLQQFRFILARELEAMVA